MLINVVIRCGHVAPEADVYGSQTRGPQADEMQIETAADAERLRPSDVAARPQADALQSAPGGCQRR